MYVMQLERARSYIFDFKVFPRIRDRIARGNCSNVGRRSNFTLQTLRGVFEFFSLNEARRSGGTLRSALRYQMDHDHHDIQRWRRGRVSALPANLELTIDSFG